MKRYSPARLDHGPDIRPDLDLDLWALVSPHAPKDVLKVQSQLVHDLLILFRLFQLPGSGLLVLRLFVLQLEPVDYLYLTIRQLG